MAAKSIILTGAAGGIGMATLEKLFDAGYFVYAGAMDDWELQVLEAEKQRLGTERVIPVMLDVREEPQIQAVLSKIQNDHPNLMGVIANGAACPVGAPFELTDLNSTRDVLETNVIGNMRLLQGCIPILKKSQGRIIMVSSMWGLVPGSFASSYTASKHACEAYCGVLRREMKEFGIDVVIINPGGVKETYMVAHQYNLSRDYVAQAEGTEPKQVCDIELDMGGNTRLVQPQLAQNSYYTGHFRTYMDFTQKVWRPETLKICATPADCARDIMRALQDARPKIRYMPGGDVKTFSFLKRALPESWIDKMLILVFAPSDR